MANAEKFYEQFISGELEIKPESFLKGISSDLKELEQRLGLNFEQYEEIRELILKAASDYGKAMFFSGFELAAKQQHQ